MRILGVDPGSRVTGYGIVDCSGTDLGFVSCGTIRTTHEEDFSRRLWIIFSSLAKVIETHAPEVAAIEEVFVDRNVRSALKLGHARGAAIVAAMENDIQVHHYTARTVKQTVTGYGQADKKQVQHMVTTLLELNTFPSQDAADALAIAICHAQHCSFMKLCSL
ncbi:crossover junction endodeoxyribonuclease RuvC [Desulfogranum japonicum]|uniref:crossover junction endodeoxyribonuclease RuvC n=1 Tax=Desulfogranum japonicum TaxID=231447 RepID=UPI0003FB84B6|nr:crossover junction endodeoxyribonuclease RuvC [Desulfogranum japonicum]